MLTLTFSEEYIRRDFKNFLSDTKATANKYTIDKYAELFIETLFGFYGVYNNKYLKTTDFNEIKAEISFILKEVK